MKNNEAHFLNMLDKKYEKSLQALNEAAIIKNQLIANHHPIAMAQHVTGIKYDLPIVTDTRGINQDREGNWYWWAAGIVVENNPIRRRDKWKEYI